ncbi:conserved hypothetical protein [Leishmania major strain Friedlin]|uniref:Transmembrane protein n=1 Tax=Leishmania major TaxID=5664 RepID=E9ACL1_LEIMA|nr:conserved hypothetical protein [Leishmania major strain Friedlin]CAG9567292.1 hypothetical_protein_-_conserved [Leishmania major strain Friedlin]CBZ12028.1 conserved hypothetical protein [Leishmania major strain Friedlin]|eukprot:XP_003721742.1 conserved hypothetical protein [Leishmania major strain Friedlin]
MSPIHRKHMEVLGLGVKGTANDASNTQRPAGALSREEEQLPRESSLTTGATAAAAAAAASGDVRHGPLPEEDDLSNATVVLAAAAETTATRPPIFGSGLRRFSDALASLPLRHLLIRGSSFASPLRITSVCLEPCHTPGAEETAAATRMTAPAHDAGANVVTLMRSLPSRTASVVMPSLRAFRERLCKMSLTQILWIILLVALVMVGNFMQIVMLNFWLISFPSDGTPGNYTAFAVPGIFFAVLFVLLLGAYTAIRRPSLRFARHAHGWVILIGVGFCDAFNSWLATYAASYTSEVLQALFSNLCPLYAVFLCKWILHDTRRYANVYIVSVFVLTICGILAASLYGLIKDHNMGEGKWWILIFFLSMPFRVLMNVWQSLYMIVYTHDPNFVLWLRMRLATAEEAAEPVSAAERGSNEVTPDTSDTFFRGGADVVAGPASPLDADCAKVASSIARYNDRTLMSGLEDEEDDKEELRNARPARHAKTKLANSVKPSSVDANDDDAVGDSTEAHEPVASDSSDGTASGGVAITPAASPDEPATSRVNEHGAVHDLSGVEDGEYLRPTATGAPPLPTRTMFTVRYNQGEDTVVKLVMLAGETVIQLCFTLCLLPADALPWWGNSETVSATLDNFAEGIRCVFTIRDNFLYCFLYTLGFVFTYVGCAYLNHYSAALCSIVTQLSSPVTALMLVIVPSWNVQVDGDSPWYYNMFAIFFLCVAALIYVMWEEMTDAEKVQAEYELKMKELRVRPSSHEAPHLVTMQG